jgi:hypothetical protein
MQVAPILLRNLWPRADDVIPIGKSYPGQRTQPRRTINFTLLNIGMGIRSRAIQPRYFLPLDPNPPAFRLLSARSSTTSTAVVSTGYGIRLISLSPA